jgi:hypothetical protein
MTAGRDNQKYLFTKYKMIQKKLFMLGLLYIRFLYETLCFNYIFGILQCDSIVYVNIMSELIFHTSALT